MSFNQLSAANLKEIFTEARLPLQAFLLKHSHERERAFFVSTTKKLWSKEAASKVQPDDLRILIPAFTVSELTAAFPIGFLLYLPFIAINLIVSNILLAMGVKAGLASFILVVYMGFLFVFFQDSFLKTEQILGLLRRVVS
jgi:type III secretion protein R